MSPLLAPIFAQLVSLLVSDRTEGRIVFTDGVRSFAASTAPSAGVSVGWKHFSVLAAYTPWINVDTTLDRPDIGQRGTLSLTYRQQFRRTTLTISQGLGYTQQNVRADALAPIPTLNPGATQAQGNQNNDANTPSGQSNKDQNQTGSTNPSMPNTQTPTIPTTQQAIQRAIDQTVRYATLVSTVRVDQAASRTTTFGGSFTYTLSGGLDTATRADYPLVSTESVIGYVSDQFTRRDSATANVSVTYSAARDGTVSWVSGANETLTHRFTSRTSASFGAGVAATLEQLTDGVDVISIYPTFLLGFNQSGRLAHGTFAFTVGAGGAPALDVTTGAVDPRISVIGSFSWSRDRVHASVALSSAISVTKDQNGGTTQAQSALNSISAGAGVGYTFGAGFSGDTGIRAAWQELGGETLVPPSWAVFVALSWAGGLSTGRNQ
jgi:hypothetical protein